MRRGVSVFCGTLLCSIVSGVRAQSVSGHVRAAGVGTPISSAVVSVVDSSGLASRRTLTDETGRYSIQVSARAAALRVVRIGYRPITVPITAATVAGVDIAMEPLPVILDAMRVSSETTCGNTRDGRAVLELWDQARAALLTAVVAREANPATVTTLSYDRRLEPREKQVTEQQVRLSTGRSQRPFAARAATALASEGYMLRSGGDETYYAPDADVLFDESFAASHCFGLEQGEGERAGQIGLTFAPRREVTRRNRVDVDGVLWVTIRAPELVQLDYRYTGVDAAREGSGGSMHFQTMRNGIVFIDAWSILLPMTTSATERSFGGVQTNRSQITELGESGGYVLSARWPDSSRWIGKIGGIRGRVFEIGGRAPVIGASVSLGGVLTTETDAAGEYSFTPMPPGRYALSVHDSTFALYMRPRQDTRVVVVTRADTLTEDFAIQGRATLLDQFCKGHRRDKGRAVLLGQISDGSDSWPRGLSVESSWLADFSDVAGGRGAVSVNMMRQTVEVDESGRFFACGVAPNRPITLRALVGRAVVADTVMGSAASPGLTRIMTWTTARGVFANGQRGDASAFSGRVTSDGAPIPDVQVWVLPRDTTLTTDSLGQFRVVGLQAGQQIVQLRRVGFDVRRDTITLRSRQETTREYTMVRLTTELDTVRATGREMYVSPRLRAFEERRATGAGYFISEAALRKFESASLPSLLREHLPGAVLVSHRGAQYLGSLRSSGMTGSSWRADPNDARSPFGCWARVFMDGLEIYDGPPGTAPDINNFTALHLSGVEYYAGPATTPPQYKSLKSTCALLLLWTRAR